MRSELSRARAKLEISFPDDNRELEPPDSISNSEVKRLIADGSVGLPHVRVGHRQDLIQKASSECLGLFCSLLISTIVVRAFNAVLLDSCIYALHDVHDFGYVTVIKGKISWHALCIVKAETGAF